MYTGISTYRVPVCTRMYEVYRIEYTSNKLVTQYEYNIFCTSTKYNRTLYTKCTSTIIKLLKCTTSMHMYIRTYVYE